jgi:hypothetical protein
MRSTESTGVGNSFERVYPVDLGEQQYRSEINGLLHDLNALLPRYRMCVDEVQYASERNKLVVLTACYNDTSLDESGLETLLQSLTKQHSAFTAVLHKACSTTSPKRSR